MSTDNFHFDITATAGADLSTHQYKFVKFDSGNVILCAAATDVPLGVLQNKPTSGQAATVRVLGVTKVVSGGVIAQGAPLGTDANGLADDKAVTDTTNYVVGIGLATAAASDVTKAAINCLNPTRAN